MPKRIQRKRSKGWRMPPGAVYVGRPTIWGNPFQPYSTVVMSADVLGLSLAMGSLVWINVLGGESCQAWYRVHLEAICNRDEIVRRRMLDPLRGQDLACWCPLDWPWCHAEVLLEMANR